MTTPLRAVLAFVLAACPAAAGDVGEMLFGGTRDGIGEIALGGASVDAARFPCGSCHGRDGRGGGESDAPPIDWPSLSRPAPDRPAYDRNAFAAALRDGASPSGRPLASTMPRYRLDNATIASLADFLAALPRLQRRGITADTVTIGVAVPTDNAGVAEVYATVLADALAAQPAFYGRTARVAVLAGPNARILERAETEVAAVVGLAPSAVLHHTDFLDRGVPVLAPLYPIDGDEDRALVRALSADWDAVVEALAGRLEASPGPIVVVSDALTSSVYPGLHRRIMAWLGPDALVTAETVTPDTLERARSVVLIGQDSTRMSEVATRLDTRSHVFAFANLAGVFGAASRPWTTPPTLVSPQPALLAASAETGQGLLHAHAEAVAALLGETLVLAGRDLTRTGLIRGMDMIKPSPLGADFTASAVADSRDVGFVEFQHRPPSRETGQRSEQ